jgi:hypothetical protein
MFTGGSLPVRTGVGGLVCSGLLVLMALLNACAVINQPTGGIKDIIPPRLDTAVSTPNFQVNFRPDEIELVFDEYIQLKSPAQNIILTPNPISGRPKYEARARRLNIDLSDVEWRDSTTYQMMFGEAIQDLNEGNIASGLRLFSRRVTSWIHWRFRGRCWMPFRENLF